MENRTPFSWTLPKIWRILWRSLFVGVCFLLWLIFLLQLPPVQRILTPKISKYLTETTGGQINIESLYVTLKGEVRVRNLLVCDPNNQCYLQLADLSMDLPIRALLKGDMAIGDLRLEGLHLQLYQDSSGSNIQYLIEAFQPEHRDTTSSNLQLSVATFSLLDSHINIESADHYILDAYFNEFRISKGRVSMDPQEIMINEIRLNNSTFDLFTYPTNRLNTDSTDDGFFSPLDLYSGFDIHIAGVRIEHNQFGFNESDPRNLKIDTLSMALSQIELTGDTLHFALEGLQASLPGYHISEVNGQLGVGTGALDLQDFRLKTPLSTLTGNLLASFASWPSSLEDLNTAFITADLNGTLDTHDMRFFVSDLHDSLTAWGPLNLQIAANQEKGRLKVQECYVQNKAGHVRASGTMDSVFTQASPRWQGLSINGLLKASAVRSISPQVGNISLPSELTLQVISSGSLSRATIEGRLQSSWGDIDLEGELGWQQQFLDLDIKSQGKNIRLNNWLGLGELGMLSFDVQVEGRAGAQSDLLITGALPSISLLDVSIRDIGIKARYRGDQLTADLIVNDPEFPMEINTQVTFLGPIRTTSSLHLQQVNAGKLLNQSPLHLSGRVEAELLKEGSELLSTVYMTDFTIADLDNTYSFDSLSLMTEITPSFNSLRLDSDDFNGSFQSNFALKDLGATVKERLRYHVQGATAPTENLLTKRLNFDLQMEQPEPLRWLGLNIKKLSGLRVMGELVPTQGNLNITMELQQLVWSDISLNDVDMGVQVSNENALANLSISSVHYDTVKMGALHYNLISQENAMRSRFSFRKDSMTILDLQGSAARQQDRFYFVIDSLLAFNRPLQVSSGHAILFNDQSLSFEDLEIRDKDFVAYLSGNENQFELSWVNGNLHHIHDVWGKYWMEDIHGFLNGEVRLDRQHEVLDVTLEVDSLSVNSSHPAQVHLSAHKAGSAVPFNLSLNSQSNLIDFSGSYSPLNKAIKATVDVDVRELEQMQYLFDTYLEELKGSVRGNVSIAGTLDNPETKGSFNLKQVNLGVRNPRAQLQIENQSLVFNGSEIIFDQFTIRDQLNNKLVVNGKINPGLKQALSYSLNIFSDNFVLFDTPQAEDRPLHGKLVLGTDFLLSGQDRDINIKGSLTIKDSTAVTYVTAPEDIVLTTGEGIVTFVDPHADPDTLKLDLSSSLYDSLVANLPDFNLETNLTIEPEAAFKVVIDPQSGDYIELSGAADMEFAFDRTGNVQLSGVYNLSRGTYQLSFYDIVSKKFELSPGSTVTWNGNPLSGKLNIAAINSIKTSSIGLVGNEIGEGEKALYRKPLDYLVGINIRGSIEYPEISFSMDLSKNDRSNYPVLANKLDRLNQPEFEGELNRQVFGLLVLGGFLPENTSSDINTGVMATTALANSVNSILANQLNQITNRYIKGVDIDIGLESYSDFTSGGGQTRTAMEFRVSKTLANDRLSIEAGGSFDLDSDQSGTSRGDGYKGDIAIIYDLTAAGNKKLKLFNNETYDIIYHEVRNTGISLIFVREFDKRQKKQ